MIKRGKRGQFYLVAAVIIAMVVFSLATISNYAKLESRETEVFDLRSEMGLESGRVIDFAMYNGTDISRLLENWTEMYVAGTQDKEVENWIFVYGNPETGITVLEFTSGIAGTVSVGDGSGDSVDHNVKRYEKKNNTYYGDDIDIVFGDFTYNFNTAASQNFAFLINKEGYVADSRLEGEVVFESEEN